METEKLTSKEISLLRKHKVTAKEYRSEDFKTDIPILKALLFTGRMSKEDYEGPTAAYCDGYYTMHIVDGVTAKTFTTLNRIKQLFKLTKEETELYDNIMKEKWGSESGTGTKTKT